MFPSMCNIPKEPMYRVQLPPDAHWSEWRPITEPIKEAHILSLQITETVTKEQYAEFAKQITW